MGTRLTEKDIRKFMKDLEYRDTYKPRDSKTGRFLKGPRIRKQNNYVFFTGVEGMKLFNESFKNLINER